MPRGGFGVVESRRSKTSNRIVSARARYWGPDGKRYSQTFGDKLSAQMWLVEERKLIDRGEWRPPDRRDVVRRLTVAEWATEYVESRSLAPSTYRNYTRMVRVYVEPTLGRQYLHDVTITDVAAWHAQLKADLRKRAKVKGRTNGDGAGEAAQVYKFVSGVFRAAVSAGLIDASPVRITGAGRYRRHRTPVVLTPDEIEALARALPEKYLALADVMAWTGLRVGEVRALRRRDVDVRDPDGAAITVAQNVSQGGRGVGAVVGRPKTEAGSRTIAIPRVVAESLAEHLRTFAQPGRDGLVFPSRTGTVLSEATWRYAWITAREKAGLPDVKTHDLRHTSLTMAARAGATTAELMHRGGHTEARIAMIYQHATAERDRMITKRMVELRRGDELAARRAWKGGEPEGDDSREQH
ncbi:site-specific integrase [Isoptericola hypogeus]|uniref:Site-specific integrase n=1 Tax=Isoptericola hypogeus TaxID=300179 RepID=A0ABP4VV92_9MICO